MFKVLKAGQLKPFKIVLGLVEGYGSNTIREVKEVEDLIEEWMRDRIQKGLFFLTGNVVAGNLVYAWPTKNDPMSTTEPSATFLGDVNPIYNSDISDEDILSALRELAGFLGTKLNQTRVYLSYLDRIEILEDEERVHPTS